MGKVASKWLALAIGAVAWSGAGHGEDIERFGGWHYEKQVDPITDAESYSAWLASVPDSPEQAMMVIGCGALRDPLRIGVKFNRYLGAAEGPRDLTWRYGTWPAVTEPWNYVGGYIAGKVLTNERSEMRNAFQNGGPLYIRAVTSSGENVDAEFEAGGGEGAIARLLIDCKLDPRFP